MATVSDSLKEPVALWTAVLALATFLAVVVPLISSSIANARRRKANRLIVLLMLRMMGTRIEMFMKDLGSPARTVLLGAGHHAVARVRIRRYGSDVA